MRTPNYIGNSEPRSIPKSTPKSTNNKKEIFFGLCIDKNPYRKHLYCNNHNKKGQKRESKKELKKDERECINPFSRGYEYIMRICFLNMI